MTTSIPDDSLACPSCHAGLQGTPSGYVCAACAARFESRDGLPILLPPRSSSQRDHQAHIHDELSRAHNARKLPIYWQTGFRYVFNLLMVKHERMIARLRPRPAERYLDVGCQDGMILSQVVNKYGVRGTGVDVSEESLRLAVERNDLGNRYYLADALALPFHDDVFDCVHSVGTMEHVPDQRKYLSEMARVMRPGGRLLFDMINRRDALTVHGIERWWAARHGRGKAAVESSVRIGHDPQTFLEADEAKAMCGQAGLAVTSVSHYNAIFPLFFDTRAPRLLARLRGRRVDFAGRPLAGADGRAGDAQRPAPSGEPAAADEAAGPGRAGLIARRMASLGLKGLLPVAELLDLPLTAAGYGNTFYVVAEKR